MKTFTASPYKGGLPHSTKKVHPFQYNSVYRHAGQPRALGYAHVYKVPSRLVSNIISHKEKVPNSNIYYAVTDGNGQITTHPETTSVSEWISVLAWIRRSSLVDLSDAVATMSMLTDTVVVVRAFEL